MGTLEPGLKWDPHGCSGPELCLPDGSRKTITASMQTYKMMFKCIGCTRGQQHIKVCTIKSLTRECDLWCAICFYNKQKWKQAGKRLLPECELRLMSVLVCLNMDTQFSFQTVAPFWQRPVDCCHLQLGYFVQLDGPCHWRGIRQHSRQLLLERDFEQNEAAMHMGGVLVRVHNKDLPHVQTIHAALMAAAMGYSIVLTPSYGCETYIVNGDEMLYVEAVQLMMPNCHVDVDEHGNHRFWICNMLT